MKHSWIYRITLRLNTVFKQARGFRAWCLSVLFLLVTATTAVALTFTEGDYTYTVIDGKATIIDFNSSYSGPLSIANSLGGYPVTRIETTAFAGCAGLTAVTVPASVVTINNSAFSDCPSLTAVRFLGNAPSLGIGVFDEPNTTTVYYIYGTLNWPSVPNFWGGCCRTALLSENGLIYEITNPYERNSVILIDYNGAASEVDIPSAFYGMPVTAIGEDAFYECLSLTDVTIPASVKNLGQGVFRNCFALESVVIGHGIGYIGEDCFYNCISLSSVIIGNGVGDLNWNVFRECPNLTRVIIGSGVNQIYNMPYDCCRRLTTILVSGLNPSYSSINGVLYNKERRTLILCPKGKAGSFIIPDSVTQIENEAFSQCAILTSLTIGDGVSYLDSNLFRECTGLIHVTIGDGVSYLDGDLFRDCPSLTSLTIGSKVNQIQLSGGYEWRNFISITVSALNPYYSSMDGVLFEKRQTTLVQYPMGRSGSYTIPDGVISIGNYAFDNCDYLTRVVFPDSVASIDQNAFNGADSPNLTGLYFKGDAPSFDGWIYSGGNGTVYYLPGTAGWEDTYGALPTALWMPRIQTGDASFGVRESQFGFNVVWEMSSGMAVVVEACTNLSNQVWVPVVTHTFSDDTFYFSDPQWGEHATRFYRLRMP